MKRNNSDLILNMSDIEKAHGFNLERGCISIGINFTHAEKSADHKVQWNKYRAWVEKISMNMNLIWWEDHWKDCFGIDEEKEMQNIC